MEQRFIRNIPSITEEEQTRLNRAHAAVIGLGGLGSAVCEMLTRLGVGELTIADFDVYSESNLNRQMFSSPENIGLKKAAVVAEEIKKISPDVKVHVLSENLKAAGNDTKVHVSGENPKAVNAGVPRKEALTPDIIKGSEDPAGLLTSLLKSADVVIDCLDNVPDRLTLEDICKALNIPLVHGAINSWTVQAATVMPGDNTLHKIYADSSADSASPSCPVTTARICAAIQVNEALKILTGREPLYSGKLFTLDTDTMESIIINM